MLTATSRSSASETQLTLPRSKVTSSDSLKNVACLQINGWRSSMRSSQTPCAHRWASTAGNTVSSTTSTSTSLRTSPESWRSVARGGPAIGWTDLGSLITTADVIDRHQLPRHHRLRPDPLRLDRLRRHQLRPQPSRTRSASSVTNQATSAVTALTSALSIS